MKRFHHPLSLQNEVVRFHHFKTINRLIRSTKISLAFFQDESDGLDEDCIEEESSINIEQLARCKGGCFEEFCFENKTFDIKQFASLAKTFFGDKAQKSRSGYDSSGNIKAKVLSRLMRKMFVLLTLTKRQIDVLNRNVKAVLVFVNPDNCSVPQKIHSGYLSCLRESINQAQSTDIFVKNCFDACEKYSIALDSALFGQDLF